MTARAAKSVPPATLSAAREAPPSPAAPLGVSATAGAQARNRYRRALWNLMARREPTPVEPSRLPRSPTQRKEPGKEFISERILACEANPLLWLAAARLRHQCADEAMAAGDYGRGDEHRRVAYVYEQRAARAALDGGAS